MLGLVVAVSAVEWLGGDVTALGVEGEVVLAHPMAAQQTRHL